MIQIASTCPLTTSTSLNGLGEGQIASANEGQTVYVLLQTTHVPAGTEYSYAVTGISPSDLATGSLTGTVKIDSTGSAILSFGLRADQWTDGVETMSIAFAAGDDVQAQVRINDTSTTPASVVADVAGVNEGATVTFTYSTLSALAGQSVTYTLEGVDAADVAGGAISGTLTIGPDGKVSLPVTLLADATTEGAETLTATFTRAGVSVSTDVSVLDSSTTNNPVGAVSDSNAADNTVAENSAVGTVVGVTASATDPQAGDSVTYSLTSNVGNLFAIDAQTGVVTVNGALDFEAAAARTITVTATSSDGSTSNQDFTIAVTDVAEQINLTSGADNGPAFTAGDGDDTFNGSERTDVNGVVVATWTVGDAIVGGLGNDTFNVVQTAAVTNPLGATVAGVETMNVTTAATTGLDTTTFGGLTALNTTSVGDADLTAAATTNVTATVTGQVANGIAIDGGNNVTLTAAGAAVAAPGTATIDVGGTTAPSGTISVTSTPDAAGGGAITVTGAAAPVTVTQHATVGNGGIVTVNNGSIVTVSQDAIANKAGGAVTVNGGVATTEVTVTHTGAGTAALVAVNDVNLLSLTDAGTITEVTLGTYGNATINSSALTTVNISGTGGTLGITHGALTVDNVTALTINANGATKALLGNAITVNDAGITTINLDSSTAASTIDGLVAAAAKSVNISGDAALTLTTQTLAAAAAIVSTNTVGVTLTAALGNTQSFTGGAGADKIEVAGATSTVAYSMGEGDDTVTITAIAGAGMGVGGSIAGNGGTDTLVMTSANAVLASANAAFNTDVTGFDSLRLTGAIGANTVDVDGINNVTTVTLAADAVTGIINNIDSGGTVNQELANTGTLTVNVDSAALSVTDVLNVGLGLVTTVANTNFGTLAAANVETINIATTNSGVAGANDNTLALTGSTGLTTVTVTGTGDLALTGVATVTTINAATLLGGVTIASNNVTTPVTFTGGLGDDSYTGSVVVDTVNLASGGKDTVAFGATLALNGLDTVNGFTGGAIALVLPNQDILNLGAGAVAVLDSAGNAIGGLDLVPDTFNTATAAGDLVIAGNNANAYLVTTGTATLPGALVTVGTGANGEIVVGNGLTAYVLQAEAANSTTFNVYRVFDNDGTAGIAPAVELLGVVNMTNAFSTLVAANVA